MQDKYLHSNIHSNILKTRIDRTEDNYVSKSIERKDRITSGERAKTRPGSYKKLDARLSSSGIKNSYLSNTRQSDRVKEHVAYNTCNPGSISVEPAKQTISSKKVTYNVPKPNHLRTEAHDPKIDKVSVKRNSANAMTNNLKYMSETERTPSSILKVHNQPGSFFSNTHSHVHQASPPVESCRRDHEIRVFHDTSNLIDQIQRLTTELSKKENELRKANATITCLENNITSLNFRLTSTGAECSKDKYVITELKAHFIELEKKNGDLIKDQESSKNTYSTERAITSKQLLEINQLSNDLQMYSKDLAFYKDAIDFEAENKSKIENDYILAQKEVEDLQNLNSVLNSDLENNTKAMLNETERNNTSWNDQYILLKGKLENANKQISELSRVHNEDKKKTNDLTYELDVKSRNLNVLEHKFNIQLTNTEKVQGDYDKLLESYNRSNNERSAINSQFEKQKLEFEFSSKTIENSNERIRYLESQLKEANEITDKFKSEKNEMINLTARLNDYMKRVSDYENRNHDLEKEVQNYKNTLMETKNQQDIEKQASKIKNENINEMKTSMRESTIIATNTNEMASQIQELKDLNCKQQNTVEDLYKDKIRLQNEFTELQYEIKVKDMSLKSELENVEKLKKQNDDLNRELANIIREVERKNSTISKHENDKHGLNYDLKIVTNDKERIAENLKETECSLNDLQKEVRNIKDNLNLSLRNNERKEDQVRDLENKLQETEIRYTKKQKKIEALRSTVDDWIKKHDDLRSNLDQTLVNSQALSNSITDLKNQINLKNVELESYKKDTTRLENDLTVLNNEQMQQKSELSTEKSNSQKWDQDRSELNYNIKILNNTISNKDEKIEDLEKQVTYMTEMITTKEKANNKLNLDINSFKQIIKEKDDKIHSTEMDLISKKEKVKELRDEVKSLEQRITSLKSENRELYEIRGQNQEDFNQLHLKIQSIEMENADALAHKDSEIKRLNSELMIQNSKYDQKIEDNEGFLEQIKTKDCKIEEYKARVKEMLEDKHKLQALIDHLHHEIDEIENTKMIIMESNNQKLIDMESALQQKDMESYQVKVEISDMKSALDDFQAQRTMRLAKIKDLETKINDLHIMNEKNLGEIDEANDKQMSMDMQLKQSQNETKKSKDQLRMKNTDNDSLKKVNEELEFRVQQLNKECEQIRKEKKDFINQMQTKTLRENKGVASGLGALIGRKSQKEISDYGEKQSSKRSYADLDAENNSNYMSNSVLNQYKTDSNYYSQPLRTRTYPQQSEGKSTDVLIKGKADIESEEGEFQEMAQSIENKSDNPKPTEKEGFLNNIDETNTNEEVSNRNIEKDQENDKPAFCDIHQG